MRDKGKIFVFVGPAGCGKSTVINDLLDKVEGSVYLPSVVTRNKREGEVEGDPYHFVTKEEFEKLEEQGKLIEKENIHHNWYGTMSTVYQDALDDGKIIFKDIGVEGALNFKKVFGDDVYTVYVDVDREKLVDRMRSRGETEKEIGIRIERIAYENGFRGSFDKVVVNNELEDFLRECKEWVDYKMEECSV